MIIIIKLFCTKINIFFSLPFTWCNQFDQENRYGFEELLAHSFFNDFNFEVFEMNQPPLIPVIIYPTDTSHFEDLGNSTSEVTTAENSEIPDCELAKLVW